jgi:hypothetical protein
VIFSHNSKGEKLFARKGTKNTKNKLCAFVGLKHLFYYSFDKLLKINPSTLSFI